MVASRHLEESDRGIPLSTFLFVLAMEGLSSILWEAF